MEDAIACSFEVSVLTKRLWHGCGAAKIRRRQCAALHLRCSQVDGYVLVWKAGGFKDELVHHGGSAMLELVRIFKRALKLVTDCGSDRCWLQIATARLHAGQEFKNTLEDLEEVVEAVIDRVLGGGGGGAELGILRHKYLEDRFFAREELESAEKIDREELAAQLEAAAAAAAEEEEKDEESVSAHALRRLAVNGLVRPLRLRSEDVTWHMRGAPLGKGASGTVYRADWLGHPVAVKVFNRNDLTFVKEVEAMTKLARPHPHVLQMIGFVDLEDGKQAIVMELMKMDLRKFLESSSNGGGGGGEIPFHIAIDLLLQIAKGTRFLHEHDVLHRDLKPQNVLVDFDDHDRQRVNVALTDFGIARTGFDTMVSEQLTGLRGTPRYMAPEIVASEVHYSRKVDVYSFGVLCSEVLTGSPPFVEESFLPIERLKVILNAGHRPRLPDLCPVELRDLITRCWSSDAAFRPDFSEIELQLASIKKKFLVFSSPTVLSLVSSSSVSNSGTNSSSNSASASVRHHDDRFSFNIVRPGVEELRLRGAAEVGSKLHIRFQPVNGTSFLLCRWVSESEHGVEQAERMKPVLVPVTPSTTSIPEFTYTVTAADYKRKVALHCLPLNSAMSPGVMAKKFSSRIGLSPEMQESIRRSYERGQTSFKVVRLHPKWWETTGKLFINRLDYLLWWGQGNPSNVRYVFSDAPSSRDYPVPIQLSRDDPLLCDLRRSDGSSCVIKFMAPSTRDEAVLTMIHFWERRSEAL